MNHRALNVKRIETMQVAHFNGSIRDSQAQAAVKPAASNGAKSASTPVAKPEQAAKPKTPAPAAGQVGGKVSAAATIVVKTPPQVAAQARAAEFVPLGRLGTTGRWRRDTFGRRSTTTTSNFVTTGAFAGINPAITSLSFVTASKPALGGKTNVVDRH